MMIHLSEPTVFVDLNKAEQKEQNYARDTLELATLKYKHFRSIAKYPEADQMHHLMMAMTGLTEDDIGELTPNDAAEVSAVVFQSMKKYMDLGKKVVQDMNNKS